MSGPPNRFYRQSDSLHIKTVGRDRWTDFLDDQTDYIDIQAGGQGSQTDFVNVQINNEYNWEENLEARPTVQTTRETI